MTCLSYWIPEVDPDVGMHAHVQVVWQNEAGREIDLYWVTSDGVEHYATSIPVAARRAWSSKNFIHNKYTNFYIIYKAFGSGLPSIYLTLIQNRSLEILILNSINLHLIHTPEGPLIRDRLLLRPRPGVIGLNINSLKSNIFIELHRLTFDP